MIAQIDALIAKLTILHNQSTGTRQGTWKVRIHEAKVAKRRLSKANRSQGKVTASHATYHGEGWTTMQQGGAIGLKK